MDSKGVLKSRDRKYLYFPTFQVHLQDLPGADIFSLEVLLPRFLRQKLRDALSRAPGIGGKRSIAFVAGSGPGVRKALVALMSDMEKQGCFIIDQRAFGSEKEAYEFGRNVTLKES